MNWPAHELLEEAFASGRADYAALKPLMRALSSMSAENISEFQGFFNAQRLNEPQIMLWRMFFSAWGELDPDSAIAFIDSRFRDLAARRLFYAAVMDTWGHDSIDGLLSFASQKYLAGSEDDRAKLVVDYLRALAAEDPRAATDMAKLLGDEEFVIELAARQIVELAKDDREAALAAIEGLEGEAHTHAAGRFMVEWAKQDITAASSWLVENYTSELGTYAITGVAAEFVKRDPDAAIRWIESLPADVPRDKVVAGAFSAWAESDSAAAFGWLHGAAVGKIYDSAVVAAGQRLAGGRPQEVMEEWVPKVSDRVLANQLLYEVSLSWQRDNSQAYSQWLETTQAIAPDIKQRLLIRELPGENAAGSDPAANFQPEPEDQGRGESEGG